MAEGSTGEKKPRQQITFIAVEAISPSSGGQARQDFDADRIRALADSLSRSGMREPVIVAPHRSELGRFELVAGERRWRAARAAGLRDIPCIVDAGLAAEPEKALAQAEENLLRENLNPVEEGAVLSRLMETRGIGIAEAGALVGRGYLKTCRLLQLHAAPLALKEAVVARRLEVNAALELIRIHNKLARTGVPAAQEKAQARLEELLAQVVHERWPVRRLQEYGRLLVEGREAAPATPPAVPAAPANPTSAGGGAKRASPERTRRRERAGSPATAEQGPDSPAPAFTRTATGLLVDVARVKRGGLAATERATLVAILEELLRHLRADQASQFVNVDRERTAGEPRPRGVPSGEGRVRDRVRDIPEGRVFRRNRAE